MAPRSMLITLAIVGVFCSIAVLLARRWKLNLLPACLAALGWATGCVVAFSFIQSSWPPLPWTSAALESEPWESVVYAIAALSILWPLVAICAYYWPSDRWPNINLLVAMVGVCLPLLAALCLAERFTAFIPGNTAWALATVLAAGANWLAMQHMHTSGAGRWCLWILVGQALTVAAMIMTCYARFGEWATAASLCLSVVAIARVLVPNSDATWSISLSLPALALNCVLLMHIREYRSNPLPLWFLPLPYLLPVWVAVLDKAWSNRLHPLARVGVAALSTAAIAGASIAIILALNGPSEW